MVEVEGKQELSAKAQVIVKIITAAQKVGKMLETPGVSDRLRAELLNQIADQRKEIGRLTRHTLTEVEDYLTGEGDAVARDLARRFGIVAGVHIPL